MGPPKASTEVSWFSEKSAATSHRRLSNWGPTKLTRPGKRLHNYGKSPCLMGKFMKIHYFDWAIFNSYVKLPEGKGEMEHWILTISYHLVIKHGNRKGGREWLNHP